jgi:hypothetical protein
MGWRVQIQAMTLYSVTSKAEAIIATSRRVFIDGPVANKSFIAGASAN